MMPLRRLQRVMQYFSVATINIIIYVDISDYVDVLPSFEAYSKMVYQLKK